MDQLRRLLANIQKQLSALSSTQKLLICSLGVIMLMTLFLVSQYAGKQVLVPLLPGASMEDQQKAASVLKSAGISFEERPSGIMVSPEKREEAFAAIGQSGSQPANTSIIFENILKTQNWLNSREQNRQIYKVMLDNWLSGVLSKFSGIRRAQVFVDAPESTGIGQAARRPKASVTLFSESGKLVPQETVDAAARLVAGSVSGLEVENVIVNDGSAGRPRKVTTDAELTPTTYRDYAASVEQQFKTKIESMLRYIDPPAVVEVTASVDVTHVRAVQKKNFGTGEGTVVVPKKETNSSTTETQASTGAEPGVRSNAAADINSGSGKGGKSETKQEDVENQIAVGSRDEQIDDPRGNPTRIVASVGVPRAYIVALLQKETPAKEGEQPKQPTAKEIDDLFAKEEGRIEKSLKPHVVTHTADGPDVPGEVVVTLMSGDVYATNTAGTGPAGTGGGSSGGLGATIGTVLASGGSGLIDRAVLGVLSVVAVGMMFLMVRKAGSPRAAVPSAKELVGLPPALEPKSDLVGEADESETAMAGIEVGEDQIKATKMREQVADLVKENPGAAAKLLNRWISVEE